MDCFEFCGSGGGFRLVFTDFFKSCGRGFRFLKVTFNRMFRNFFGIDYVVFVFSEFF